MKKKASAATTKLPKDHPDASRAALEGWRALVKRTPVTLWVFPGKTTPDVFTVVAVEIRESEPGSFVVEHAGGTEELRGGALCYVLGLTKVARGEEVFVTIEDGGSTFSNCAVTTDTEGRVFGPGALVGEILRLRLALHDVLDVSRDRQAFVMRGPAAFAKAEQIAERALAERTEE